MSKLDLADVSNISGQETSAISTINSNSSLIEDALENTLSRDGTTPNFMLTDFDMDGNDILNVNNIDVISITVDGVQLSNELYSVGPQGPTGPQGPAGTTSPSASTTVEGILEIATLAESLAGTPSNLAIVSQNMKTIIDMVCPVGTVSTFLLNAVPTYWLALDGKTIGDGSSGATARANADTETLFTIIWQQTSATDLPIYTSSGVLSTKGANASVDFAAHKRIALPDVRGEFVRGWDNSRGVDVGRALSSTQTGAVETHTHTFTGQAMGAHGHPWQGTSIDSDTLDSFGGMPLKTPSATRSAYTGTPSTDPLQSIGGASAGTPAGTNSNYGGAETRPRNVSLLYCIRY